MAVTDELDQIRSDAGVAASGVDVMAARAGAYRRDPRIAGLAAAMVPSKVTVASLAAPGAAVAGIGALVAPVMLAIGLVAAVTAVAVVLVIWGGRRDRLDAVSREAARCDAADPSGVCSDTFLSLIAVNPTGYTQWNVGGLADAIIDLHLHAGSAGVTAAAAYCADTIDLYTIVWLQALVSYLTVLDAGDASGVATNAATVTGLVTSGVTCTELDTLARRHRTAVAV